MSEIHLISGLRYCRRDSSNGRFQQVCKCGAVLRVHEMDTDLCQVDGVCGRCKRLVRLLPMTMVDRFSGLAYIGDDYPISAMIATEPIVGEIADIEEELAQIEEDRRWL